MNIITDKSAVFVRLDVIFFHVIEEFLINDLIDLNVIDRQEIIKLAKMIYITTPISRLFYKNMYNNIIVSMKTLLR